MTTTAERITKAGDVSISNVTIITSRGFAQDITPQVIGVDIYEDMFTPFTTGKIHIYESMNLVNLFPLIGEEVIRISVKTPTFKDEESYIGEFYIYKMDDVIKSKERNAIYTLHFISKESIIDLNKKISRGFKGKVSDIAEFLMKSEWSLNTKKKVNIEPTANSTRYVSNFWSPVKNLLYISNNAINTNESPSYVFFENKYGLNFVSLDSLFSVGVYQRFIWDNYVNENNSLGGTYHSLERDYQRILNIYPNKSYDYISRLKTGFYGSELITYDILSKQYSHTAYVPDFKTGNHLNEFPLYSNKAQTAVSSNILFIPKYYNNFDDYDDVTNANTIQKRRTFMSQFRGYKVTIEVFGRTDYSVGKKVYLDIPKDAQITSDDMDYQNKTISGNYIMTAICHNITKESHKTIIELSKDSYMVDLNVTE